MDIVERLKAKDPKQFRPLLNPDGPEAAATITTLRARVAVLEGAGQALIDDVRSRHPGEELRCPHMIALDKCLKGDAAKSAPIAGRAWKAEGTDTPAFKLMALAYQQATSQVAEGE